MAAKGHAKGVIKAPDIVSSVVVDTSNAERELSNFLTKMQKSKKELSIDVGIGALKNAKTVWDAMASEMNRFGKTEIFDGMAKSFEQVNDSFKNIKVIVNGQELQGLVNIVKSLSSADFDRISRIDFGSPELKNNLMEVKQIEDTTKKIVENEKEINKLKQKRPKEADPLKSIKSSVTRQKNLIEGFSIDLTSEENFSASMKRLEGWKDKLIELQKKLHDLQPEGLKGTAENVNNEIEFALQGIVTKIETAQKQMASTSTNVVADIATSAKKLRQEFDTQKSTKKDKGSDHTKELQSFAVEGHKLVENLTQNSPQVAKFGVLLNEVSKGALTAADAMKQLVEYTESLGSTTNPVENIAKQTQESAEYLAAQQKLAERWQNLKSGSESGNFGRGRVYSGQEGRLTLANSLGTDLAKFNLSNDELERLIESTYAQFSKIKNLIVDKETWTEKIRNTLNEHDFGERLNSMYSMDTIKDLTKNQEFVDVYNKVCIGAIKAADAMQQAESIAAKSGFVTKAEEEARAAEQAAQAIKEKAEAKRESEVSSSGKTQVQETREETVAIEANTQAVEANVKAKQKKSKIKVREWTDDEYGAHQEQYEQEHGTIVEDTRETMDIIRSATEFGDKFAVDMTTVCKKAETAVKRFFDAIDPEKYPAVAEWKDGILESVQNGYFSDKEILSDGTFSGRYSWGVETLNEDEFYVYFNLLDIASDKEDAYSAHIDKEMQKRADGVQKEHELYQKLMSTYAQLAKLRGQQPEFDKTDRIGSYERLLEYYNQEKSLLQDIVSLKDELKSIPGKYKEGLNVNDLDLHYGTTAKEYDRTLNSKRIENTQQLLDQERAIESAKQEATEVNKLADARERLKKISKQARNAERPVKDTSVLEGREQSLTERLTEIESIKNEFPELAGRCTQVEGIVTRALDNIRTSITDVSSAASQLNDELYHAGDASNLPATLKSFPLGNVPPRKGAGIGGLTGLYTTEDPSGFFGTEWHGAPITTIDPSGYKLLTIRSNAIADEVGSFLNDLNATIYGYYEAVNENDWTLKRYTDVKSIEELYIAHQQLFTQSALTIEQFAQFINEAAAKVVGKSFQDITLPAIDEGIAKSGISSALQGVSEELFQSDSFKTVFLKMLGYEGVDLRGTKYNGTYTGGSVIFDPKQSSLKTVNERWSEFMPRHGYEISDNDLQYEEKRRQLAFETAEAYSRQVDEVQKVHNVTQQNTWAEEAQRIRDSAIDVMDAVQHTTIAYEDVTDVAQEYAKAQYEAEDIQNVTKKSALDIANNYYDTLYPNLAGTFGKQAEALVNNVLNNIFNQDGAKGYTGKLPFQTRDVENLVRQAALSDAYDGILKLIGRSLGDIKPTNVTQKDGSPIGYFADIAEDSEKVVTNLEEAREILLGIKREPSVIQETGRTTTQSELERFDVEGVFYRDSMKDAYDDFDEDTKSKWDLGLDNAFAKIREQVSSGAINCEQAIEQIGSEANSLYSSLSHDAERVAQVMREQETINRQMNHEEYAKFMKDVDLNQFFENYGIDDKKNQGEIRNAFSQLGDIIASKESVDENDSEIKGQIQEVVGLMMRYAKEYVGTHESAVGYVLDELQGSIHYTDDDIKSFGGKEQFAQIRDQIKGKLRLTKEDRPGNLDADEFFAALTDKVQDYLVSAYNATHDEEFNFNEDNILSLIANGYQYAIRDRNRNGERVFGDLTQADAIEDVMKSSNALVDKAMSNAKLMRQSEEAAKGEASALEEVNVNAENAGNSKDKFNKANKRLNTGTSESTDGIEEEVRGLQRLADGATEAEDAFRILREADGRTQTGYDFNEVFNSQDFESRIRNFANTVANDNDLRIGRVSVGINDEGMHTASVEYYNELTQRAVRQTYELRDGMLQIQRTTLIENFRELERLRQSEERYFSSREQYTGLRYDGTAGENTDFDFADREAALRSFVDEFTNGQGYVSDFITTARGIDQIEFSVIDEHTGQFRTFTAELGRMTDNIYYTETSLKNLSSGTTAAEKSLEKMFALVARLNNLEYRGENLDVSQYSNQLVGHIGALQAALQNDNGTIEHQNYLNDLATNANRALKEISKLEQEYQKVTSEFNNENRLSLGRIDQNGNIEGQMRRLVGEIENASVSNVKFDNITRELSFTLTRADGTVEDLTASMDRLSGVVTATITKSGKLKTWWQDLFGGIGSIKDEAIRYLGNMLDVGSIIQGLRTGFNEVLEIDTALTELRKVTDETDATYARFLQNMSKSGAVIGSTVKDLTTSAAGWARLGYSIEEAGKLAENTMVLMNVSEFDNVTDATDSMISAIQAFKDKDTDVTDFSMEIIDVFNKIGNSYAISTSDLADSLTRSSASLVAANNTLEQSVALTTAANTTIQNPEVVGTTLKTLAMRIRGVKTELEEAGEDTEGMITNTSKLQEKVKALTDIDGSGGIDILTNSGEFKSTYDILLEISRVWEKMGDMDQAALLEIIAGKRAGSAVAGILQNGDILESAYKDALGADGSAMIELETHLDSMQGKLEQLSNATQTMWMNFLNSDVVKFFIDLATGAVKLVDKMGLLNTVIAAFVAKMAFKGNSFMQFFDANKVAQGVQSWVDGFKKMKDGSIASATAINTVTAAQTQQGAAAAGATAANTGHAASQTAVGATATAASIGVKLLNAALSMGIMLLAGFVITPVIMGLLDLANASEKVEEAANKAKGAIEDISSEFKTNQQTVTNLAERFAELAQGVDMLTGKNLSLTTDDYEEFLDLSNQLADIFPTLSRHYDENGNAIVQLSGDTNTIVGSLENLLDVQRQIANQEIVDNIPDLYKGTKQKSDNFNEDIDALKSRREAYQEELDLVQEIANSDSLDGLLDGNILRIASDDPEALHEMATTYLKILKEAGIEFEQLTSEYNNEGQPIEFSYLIPDDQVEEAKQKLKIGVHELAEAYSDEVNNLNNQINNKEQQNKANWGSMLASISSWLSTESSYRILSDDMQSTVQTIINNMDFNSLDFKSWGQLQSHIQDNILSIFADPDLSKTVANSISGMFDITSKLQKGDISLQKYKDQMLDFVDEIKKSDLAEDVQNQILQMFDIDPKNAESIGASIDTMLNHVYSLVDDKAKGKVLQLSYSDLQIINSDNFKVPEGTLLSWDALKAKIKETKTAMTQDFTTDNFADYADEVKAVSESIAVYQEALESLESGSFSMSDFMELIEQFPDLAKGVDISSKSFDGLSDNLRKAIKNAPDNLVDELKDLRAELLAAGKSTTAIDSLIASLENMPADAVDSLANHFSTLSDEMIEAKRAMNEIKEAMSQNPNEGFETRGSAIEQMKTLMEQGAVGSESEIWDIAKAFFGDNPDAFEAIANKNADALYKLINARDEWYATDKDGKHTFDGTKNFLDDVTQVTQSKDVQYKDVQAKLQELGFDWQFDGTNLKFDFDNENWDAIVETLASTSELAGLTSEEFADLLVQVGQFFNIEWGDANDVSSYIETIGNSSKSASEKLSLMTKVVENFAEQELGQDLDMSSLTEADVDALKCDESLKNLLKTYITMRREFEDPLGIETTLDGKKDLSELAGLSSMKGIVTQNKDGTTVVDTDAFTKAAKEAGYTDEKIKQLIETIQSYENVISVTTSDPLGLKNTNASLDTVKSTLESLGVAFSEVPDGETGGITLDVNAPDLIETLKSKGWTKEQISSYLQTLTSGENGVPVTLGEVEVTKESIDAAVEEAFKTELNPKLTLDTETADAYINEIKQIYAELNLDTTKAEQLLNKLGLISDNGAGTDDNTPTQMEYGRAQAAEKQQQKNKQNAIIAARTESPVSSAIETGEITISMDGLGLPIDQAIEVLKSTNDSTELLDKMQQGVLGLNTGEEYMTVGQALAQLLKKQEESTQTTFEGTGANDNETQNPEKTEVPSETGGQLTLEPEQVVVEPASEYSAMGQAFGSSQQQPVSTYGAASQGGVTSTQDQDNNQNFFEQAADVVGDIFNNTGEAFISLFKPAVASADELTGEDATLQPETINVTAENLSLDGEAPATENPTRTGGGGETRGGGTGGESFETPETIEFETGDTDGVIEDIETLHQASMDAASSVESMWQEYANNQESIDALDLFADKSTVLTQPEVETYGLEVDESGFITVEQALTQLQEKQAALQTNIPIQVTLLSTTIDSEISALKQKIEELQADPTIEPEVKEAQIEDLEAQIATLEETQVLITSLIDGDNTKAMGAIDEVKDENIPDKKFSIHVNNLETVKSSLKDICDYLDRINEGASGNVNLTGDGGAGANGTAHVQGTAFKSGSWGAQNTETALVGELGPELLVRGNRWTTIGENGAEFANIKKGDIIFNHKQTEDLLSKGHISGRGRAYAEGTAFASGSGSYKKYSFSDTKSSSSKNLEKAAKGISKSIDDASDDFEEIFDWIAVRIEEITERIDLASAQLENAIGHSNQNNIIDDLIEYNKLLYQNLIAGAKEYNAFAEELLKKVPKKYREKAQDGAIDIEYFKGKVGDQAYSAIEEYREWVQKGAELTQQAEETLTEISTLAKQAIDNIASDYENKRSLRDNRIDQLDAYNALSETTLGAESVEIYKALMAENNKNINLLENQRNEMQEELNKRVDAGEIKKYSQDWYDAINDIAAIDTEIIELTADVADFQDAINELHWDHFDNLISRLEAVSNESDNLIDILSSKDLFDKDTYEWTDEGITTLGLYAQKLEHAEMQSKKYEEEIKYLNENWQELGYTEQEYLDKLDELKDGQYDAIKSYNDTKDAIKDLTAERVEAIKEGIQEEIDAYTELINKKKEELSAEKDLHDFQRGVADQQKEIADIERKLAALSADNSASARAQRAKLEAELAKARQDLQDTYYDRSIQDQQTALDKELENFQEEKEKEIEGWDEYLEDTEKVVSDSLSVVQENTKAVYNTLQEMGKEYSLSIAEAITSPWKQGEYAIQNYSEQFGLAMSATVEELRKIAAEYKNFIAEIEGYGKEVTGTVNNNAQRYQSGDTNNSSNSSVNNQEKESAIKVGGKINAGSAKIYSYAGDKSGDTQYHSKDPIYTVLAVNGNWVQVRHHKQSNGVTGWFKKNQIKAYASGTKAMDKDQLAIIDELGEELVIRPSNGRMAFFEKGTGVVPANLTENLMEWGELDPSTMLSQNKPEISMSPSVVNNNMELNIDCSVNELIHVDKMDGNNIAEVTKIVDKAWNKYMKELNGQIRRYANR